MNVDEILFRCSGLSNLMTEPRSKADKEAGMLSESAKAHCIDVFVSKMYGRREEVKSKYLDKGNQREEDSITLLSRQSKIFFKKNKERLSNGFITGEPDLFLGSDIRNAQQTFDTKTSWSAHTFYRQRFNPLPDAYKWQGVGYMWLTGAVRHTVAFCLVNGTVQAINDEKRRLMWSMGITDEMNAGDGFKKAMMQIERNHIFNLQEFLDENPGYDLYHSLDDWRYDIPPKERLHQITIERSEDEILLVSRKIIAARKYINDTLLKDYDKS